MGGTVIFVAFKPIAKMAGIAIGGAIFARTGMPSLLPFLGRGQSFLYINAPGAFLYCTCMRGTCLLITHIEVDIVWV